MLKEPQLELPSTVTIPGVFCLIYEIRPVSGFSESLSAKDTPLNHYPVYEIRLLRYWCLGVSATDAKNVLVADFAQGKKAATSFLLSLTDTSTRDAIRQF